MRFKRGLLLVLSSTTFASAASAQSMDDRPWLLKTSILVLDPYEGNPVDWQKVRTDPQVKAVIHRAFFGLRPDQKYEARIRQAKAAGLLNGIYLLGRPGDPIKQAEALIEAGRRINCKPRQTCFHRVPGTQSDMDVNVFRGSEAELKALFGG